MGEVYADLLFLVNFSMDLLCFYLCARLTHRPISLGRLLLASALGGVYAVAVLFLTVGRVPAFALDALVCVALTAVAFASRREGVRPLLKLSAMYLLISMVLGGIMTALFSQLNRIPGLTDRVSEEGAATWLFFFIAAISAVLSALWGRSFRRITRQTRVTVTVEQGGRQVHLAGIVDSGNLLRDPISGVPVIPADLDGLAGVAPLQLLAQAAGEGISHALPAAERLPAEGLRLIPAKGATGERLMVGWRPEHIYIADEQGQGLREVRALIAPVRLGSRRDGIAALVPTELIS